MKTPKIIFIALTFLSVWTSAAVFADTGEWTVTLTVSTPFSSVPGGVVSTPISVGARDGATNGYDHHLDTVSFLEPDDPLVVHIPHGALLTEDTTGGIQGWDCPEPETDYNAFQCTLWRDFRTLSESMTWRFEIISPLNGATVSIDWQIQGGPDDLSKLDLKLIDLDLPLTPPFPPSLNRPSHYEYTNYLIAGKKYGLRHFEIRMKTSGLFIVPSSLLPGTLNAPYSESLHLVGGGGMWSLIQGDLPPGLQLEASSGTIEGVPQQEGAFTFTVNASDPIHNQSINKEYTLLIGPALAITTDQLPSGEVYVPYSQGLTASGGTPPLSWNVISGNLPEGLSLDKNQGALSGSFQVPGIFDFFIQVEDRVGAKARHPYRITVTEPADTAAPSAISDFKVLYTSAASAVFSWSAPWDDGLIRTAAVYDLRYSKICPANIDDAWWDAALQATGEPRPVSGVLHTYTLSSLDMGEAYCAAIRSWDASGHLSSLSNIVTFPDGEIPNPESGAGFVTRQYPLQKGYNLISVPLILLPNDLSQFQDDVGSPISLYRWFPIYPEPSQWYLENAVQPGYGYFLYSPAPGITLDLTGIPVNDDSVIIPLKGGWNMVGNPYEPEVSLKNVMIREIKPSGSGEVKSFEDAARSGWVGNSLYGFNGLGYEFLAVNDDPPAVLLPGSGFWLYVQENHDYEMIFRKP